MHADWYQAARPEPAQVLKLRLREYALGHELLLQGCNCANPADLETLSLAVLICAQTYEQSAALLAHQPLSFRLFLRIWRWRIRRVSIVKELLAFNAYRGAALWHPEEETDPKPCRQPGSPAVFRIQAILMSHYGMSESQALNYPVRKASALIAAGAEQEGHVKLFNEEAADELFAKLDELQKTGALD